MSEPTPMTLSAVFNQVTMPNERDRQIAAHAFALGANAVLARIYADTNWLKLLREMEVELAEIGEQPTSAVEPEKVNLDESVEREILVPCRFVGGTFQRYKSRGPENS